MKIKHPEYLDLLTSKERDDVIGAESQRLAQALAYERQRAERFHDALVELSTHDFTSAAGCRRGQTIAAKALRGNDEPQGP